MTPWLEKQVTDVTDALMTRLGREAGAGIVRRQQMMYHPSLPGVRGGLAVIPADDTRPQGWLPVPGVVSEAYAMTRDQIRAAIAEAAFRLPVLDPTEELSTELTASGEQFVVPGCEIKPTDKKPQGNLW